MNDILLEISDYLRINNIVDGELYELLTRIAKGIAYGRQQLAEHSIQDKRDAERYRYLMSKLGANNFNGWTLQLPSIPDNWRQGSISQHFSKAIDAAIEAKG